jgi:hypothetical protein
MSVTKWQGLPVFPASIPHLLHWDLGYLWALQQEPDQLDELWSARVAAWRRLLSLFLGGELSIRAAAVPTNLASLLASYGLTEVHELLYQENVVGILSPTVVVRPLPNMSEQWHHVPAPSRDRREDVLHLLRLLAESVQETADNDSPILGELNRVLVRETLAHTPHHMEEDARTGMVRPRTAVISRPVSVDLVTRYSILPAAGRGQTKTIHVEIFDRSGHRFVPKCGQCESPLLNHQADQPIQCVGDHVQLTCRFCRRVTKVSLNHLMIAAPCSGRDRFVVWTNRDHAGDLPLQEPPPEAVLQGQTVTFQWTVAEALDPNQRFLRLFLEGPISTASINEIFYQRFLDLGELGNAAPVRSEWIPWISHWPEIQRTGPDIRFKDLRVEGLPQSINKVYGPTAQVQRPDMGVCVYPGDEWESWSDYRTFLTGEVQGFLLTGPEDAVAGRISPALMFNNQAPKVVAVQSEAPHDCGVALRRDVHPRSRAMDSLLYLGCDFGTTSSVVAYYAAGEESEILTFADIHEAADWFAKPASEKGRSNAIFPSTGSHLTQIPSSVWSSHAMNWVGIRWSGLRNTLIAGCQARKDLKWSESADNKALRTSYLFELLFWSIPAVLRKAHSNTIPASLNLGVSYPLAFNFRQRNSFRESIETVQARCQEAFGITINYFSLSESDACVRTVGRPAPTDCFLVADLGGGSLDIAAVSGSNTGQPLPIGSFRYGGELCLEKLCHGDRDRYWALRDSLAQGQPDPLFSSDEAKELYYRHIPRALEILRVLVASMQKNGVAGNIKLLLVGNGWRLLTLSSAGQDPTHVFANRYQELTDAFQLPSVSVWIDAAHDTDPKHTVAHGAAMNARQGQKNALRGPSPDEGVLPAGRTVHVSDRIIEWWELVGLAGLQLNMPEEDLRNSIGRIGLEVEPAPSTTWSAYLRRALPETQPTEESIRQVLATSIQGSRIVTGPLQAIVEKSWSQL